MDEAAGLRLFVKVVEAGSFSGAARLVGLTPSAISRHVTQLEAGLGTRLFNRTTRKQSLTEAGALYYSHAKRIAEEIDNAHQDIAQFSKGPSGTLHVTAEADFAVTFLAPLVPDFLERYPDIKLRLSMSASLIDLVGAGVDLAIRMGHLEDSSLITRRLVISRSMLLASPEYLARCGFPSHPSELSSHACLSFRTSASQTYWRFDAKSGPLDVPISGPVTVDSLAFLRKMVRTGCGIAMLPVWAVNEDLDRNQLVAVLPDFPIIPPETPISAVFANNRHLAPKVRVFVDFLAEHLGAL